MKLKQNVKEILSVEENKIKLCYLTGVSYSTMHRWLRDDHEKLTLKKTIDAMIEVTGIPETEIFEKEDVKSVIDAI